MEPNDHNPYAAPETGSEGTSPAWTARIAPQDSKKIDAIIKDAGQFWLAILICLVCSSLGTILIGPWYGVRLAQWYAMKGRYPELMEPNASAGSIQRKFQSAQTKLVIGISFGVFMFFVCGGLILLGLG